MLFNKDGKGSEELQQITGTFAASNQYSVISSEVDDAMRSVAGLVGQAVVSKAETLYENSENDPLVGLVQQPVAVLAVLRYSSRNLVTHDDSGSKIRVDENEKVPFEWMIDRDERAQRERYYRALDALYHFLESSQMPEWTDSDIRRGYSASLVHSLREFEAVYPVEGSYYVYYMMQNLVIEKQPSFRRMIGDDAWERISGKDVADKDAELLSLSRRFLILSAVIDAVRRWSVEVLPLSVARRFSPSYQGNRESSPASLKELDAYIAGLNAQISEVQEEITSILKDGANPYQDFDLLPHNDPCNKFFSAQ